MNVRAHRGTRCGFCYCALHDGEWCQNKACEWAGKEPPEKVKLSNAEAAILIDAMPPQQRIDALSEALRDAINVFITADSNRGSHCTGDRLEMWEKVLADHGTPNDKVSGGGDKH